MKNVQLLLLSMLIFGATGAFAAASASAEPCKERSELFCLASTKSLALIPFGGVQAEAETALKIEVEAFGTIECTEVKSTAGAYEEPSEAVTAKGIVLSLKSCKVVSHTECVVPAVTTHALGGPVGLLSEKQDVLLTGENVGKEWATIKVETCGLATSFVVKGELACTQPKMEEPLLTQSVVCEKGGSELKAGTKGASLTVSMGLKLTGTLSGEVWGIYYNLT